MAVDVSPEILEEIGKHFNGFYSDLRVKRIYKKIVDGTATYLDMHILSSIVAEYMLKSAEKAYTDALEHGKLPNDTLYENIVNKTMMPTLKDGHGIIAEACGYVQKDLNRKAGIKLDPVEPPFDEPRALGLVQAIANRNEVRLSQTVTGGLIDVFSRSIVDNFVQANCDFQKESGLDPQISRTRGSNANSECEYCAALVYTGEYKGPNMPDEIFRRHRYCHCNVLYDPKDGSRKIHDVWSKQQHKDYRIAEQKQRQYLNELDKMTPTERRLARNARARELRRAKYSPEEWRHRKTLEKINAERAASTGLSLEERKTYRGVDVSRRNGIISEERNILKKGTVPSSQEAINSVLNNELKGIVFSSTPIYNPRIRSQGKTSIEFYPWGQFKRVTKMEIGKQFIEDKEAIISVLIHEELEARLAKRNGFETTQKLGDAGLHPYIDKVIERFFKMKGWNYDAVKRNR